MLSNDCVKGIDFFIYLSSKKRGWIRKTKWNELRNTNIDTENQTDTMIEVKPVAVSFENIYIRWRYKSPTEIDEKIAIQRDEAINALIHYANSKSTIPDKLDRERKQALQDVLQQLKDEPEPQMRQEILSNIMNDSQSVLNKHHLISTNKGETAAMNLIIDLWAADSDQRDVAINALTRYANSKSTIPDKLDRECNVLQDVFHKQKRA